MFLHILKGHDYSEIHDMQVYFQTYVILCFKHMIHFTPSYCQYYAYCIYD